MARESFAQMCFSFCLAWHSALCPWLAEINSVSSPLVCFPFLSLFIVLDVHTSREGNLEGIFLLPLIRKFQTDSVSLITRIMPYVKYCWFQILLFVLWQNLMRGVTACRPASICPCHSPDRAVVLREGWHSTLPREPCSPRGEQLEHLDLVVTILFYKSSPAHFL